jgi:PKD repeat protein
MKSKTHRGARLLRACLVVAMLAVPLLFATPVFAAVLFEDGFESGDFVKWSYVTGATVTSGDAHHGTYKAVLDAGGEYAQAYFTAAPRDHMFMRAYVRFDDLPTSGDTTVLGLMGSGRYPVNLAVGVNGGVVKWKLTCYGGVSGGKYSTMMLPAADTWYCVEVEGKAYSTTAAESRVWINGTELTDITQTGLNNDAKIDRCYIGWTTAVPRWYDCVAVDETYIGPENSAPVANGQSVTTDEDTAKGILLVASDAENDPLTYSVVTGPTHGTLSGSAPNLTYTPADDYNGSDSFTFKANDGAADSNVAAVSVAVNAVNDPPVITGLLVPLAPMPVTAPVAVSGTFTDMDAGDTHTAVWDWGDGSTSAGVVNETNGAVTGSHSYSEAGVNTVSLTVTDKGGDSDTASAAQYVVVYDPAAGFVTGGGWITSPAGAYTADPSLTGKATFGFVSKYKKGASVPTGTTEFQFKAGDLNFHSDVQDWLVVNKAGTNAQFKGTGTVNGAGTYKFMIWATDNGASGDAFRIRIWAETDGIEDVVYDNGVQRLIGGGQIVVHTK